MDSPYLQERSLCPRAADEEAAPRDWRGASRHAPLPLARPSCRRRPRFRQLLVRYPRAPEAAGRDQASPNACQTERGSAGEANGAGDRFARARVRARQWRYRALPSQRRAASTPSSPAHAESRYPSEADLRFRSRHAPNLIRARVPSKFSALIHFTAPIAQLSAAPPPARARVSSPVPQSTQPTAPATTASHRP